jgi:mRNA-degrading endonuclease toxin of MazEF toxin-antitoxin module
MGKFEKWEIWYADCKFEDDASQSKDRPVLVVGGGSETFVLALKITGAQRSGESEYIVRKWEESGLTKPSVVQTDKKYMLRENEFRRYVGRLHPNDILVLGIMLGIA